METNQMQNSGQINPSWPYAPPYQAGGTAGAQQPQPISPPGQALSGTSMLSHRERMEAKRLAEEAAFTYQGYQLSSSAYFSSVFDPAITIREKSVTFNNSCISKLEDARYVQFLVNPEEHKIAIRACNEDAKDAVRWCVTKGDKRKSRDITCRDFTAKIFDLMGWEPLNRYKIEGMRIRHDGQILYLFDLNNRRKFGPAKRDPKTGKVIRTRGTLPEEWADNFGVSVEEHDATPVLDMSKWVNPNDIAENTDSTQIQQEGDANGHQPF